MSKPRDDRQKDLLRPPLDQIIDLAHPLARLAREIDWGFLDQRFSSVCRAGPGQQGPGAGRGGHDRAAQGRGLPDRCPANAQGDRDARPRGEDA